MVKNRYLLSYLCKQAQELIKIHDYGLTIKKDYLPAENNSKQVFRFFSVIKSLIGHGIRNIRIRGML